MMPPLMPLALAACALSALPLCSLNLPSHRLLSLAWLCGCRGGESVRLLVALSLSRAG